MDKIQAHNDALFRQKFENFVPTPPEHVWAGIESGIVRPSFFALYWKGIVAATVIIALLIGGILYFSDIRSTTPAQNELTDSVSNELKSSGDDNIIEDSAIGQQGYQNTTQINEPSKTIIETEPENSSLKGDDGQKPENHNLAAKTINNKEQSTGTSTTLNAENKQLVAHLTNDVPVNGAARNYQAIDPLKSYSINNKLISAHYFSTISGSSLLQGIGQDASGGPFTESISEESERNSKWSIGLYFAPEWLLNNFDSVELMPNYAISIEPTFFINNHLFLRFGAGINYARDRGYVQLDYLSNDLMGSYDYVYDVTFDSIDGEVVPTYHTKTMEVWDTIRHLEINSITNNYLYLQTPVLFGYYNSKPHLKWYIYGGPSFNTMISKKFEQPLDGITPIEVIELQNELPERSQFYVQLWIGAGVEFKIGKQLGLSLEPSYRYYFNNVFKESSFKNVSLSGLSLKGGLVYTIP